MSNRLAPKTQTDYIFRAIDMNITNQKMITDLMSVVKYRRRQNFSPIIYRLSGK